MKKNDWFWAIFGILAVCFAFYLLHNEVKDITWQELKASFSNISPWNWFMIFISTVGAYLALAWYDKIALLHIGKYHVSWLFVSLCSFTTYAVAHNIGASVVSGGMVRYRAYSSKGLQTLDIAVLVAFCSLTFALGTLISIGVALSIEPEIIKRFPVVNYITPEIARVIGITLLLLAAAYTFGAYKNFKPLKIKNFYLEYPKLNVVAKQLIAGPLEICCAAAIIYSSLPEHNHPGYLVVLGVFLGSFSLALLSNAPGGLGVLEFTFITSMPEVIKSDVLVALLVFRMFYFIMPLFISIFIIIAFEVCNIKQGT